VGAFNLAKKKSNTMKCRDSQRGVCIEISKTISMHEMGQVIVCEVTKLRSSLELVNVD